MSTKEHTKLFIFDVGGVMCEGTSVGQMIADHLRIDHGEFVKLAIASGLHDLQKGIISVSIFIDRFSLKIGREIPGDIWSLFFKPKQIPETYTLVETLISCHRVVAGTNTIEPHYQIHYQQRDYAVFHRVYASHHMHLAKPDPAFYQYILDTEGYNFEQTILIDDTPANIESAREMGLNTCRFQNSTQVYQELMAFLTEGHKPSRKRSR